MSVRCLTWVWDRSQAKGTDRLVLLALADSAGDTGSCYVSMAELARKASVGVSTARRSIRTLEELGELKTTRGGLVGTTRRASSYRILLSPELEAVDPGQSDTPVNLTPRSDRLPTQNDRGVNTDKAVQLHPGQSDTPVNSDRVSVTTRTKNSFTSASQEVTELCNRLADRIEANGSKRPTVGKSWHDACRLMIERDGRTPDKITAAIDWCQSHEFWRSVILSMPKLRDKYDQLRLAAQAGSGQASARPKLDRIAAGRAAGRPEAWL